MKINYANDKYKLTLSYKEEETIWWHISGGCAIKCFNGDTWMFQLKLSLNPLHWHKDPSCHINGFYVWRALHSADWKKNSPFVVCRKKEAMVEHTVHKQVDTRGRGGRGVAVGSSIFKTTIKNSCIKKIWSTWTRICGCTDSASSQSLTSSTVFRPGAALRAGNVQRLRFAAEAHKMAGSWVGARLYNRIMLNFL